MADGETPIPDAGTPPAASPEPAPAPAEPATTPASEPTLLEGVGSEAPAAEAPVTEGEKLAEGEAKPEGEAGEKAEGNIAKLLGEDEKPEDKAEAKPEGEPAAPPEPIVYQPFEMPEGITLAPEQLAAATEILGAARMPQEEAQKLLGMHTAALQEFAQRTYAQQVETFHETRRGWQNEVRSDPDMGGSGFNTAMKAIAGVRDRFVPADQRERFNEFLNVTGAGDHPAFLRFVHQISKALAEPTPPPPNPIPPANPTTKGRRETLYDHPRS